MKRLNPKFVGFMLCIIFGVLFFVVGMLFGYVPHTNYHTSWILCSIGGSLGIVSILFCEVDDRG
jgi:hypothetical protein